MGFSEVPIPGTSSCTRPDPIYDFSQTSEKFLWSSIQLDRAFFQKGEK